MKEVVAFIHTAGLAEKIEPTPCAWCGNPNIRANLDGENLCQNCCDEWVRGEGQAAADQPELTWDDV